MNRIIPPPPVVATSYEVDVYAWASQQAAFLRAGQWSRLDIEHLADEIEDVGRSEVRELRSALAVVLLHLLKWDYQPERRSLSWALSIREQRDQVLDALDDNPSLRPRLPEFVDKAYKRGRTGVLRETGLSETSLPLYCLYTLDEILTRPVEWPEHP